MGSLAAQLVQRAALILCTNRIRQLPPRLHRPVARCGTGWRGQYKDDREIVLRRLPAQHNRFRRSAIEQARGFLAGESDGPRLVAPHRVPEGRNIDGA